MYETICGTRLIRITYAMLM